LLDSRQRRLAQCNKVAEVNQSDHAGGENVNYSRKKMFILHSTPNEASSSLTLRKRSTSSALAAKFEFTSSQLCEQECYSAKSCHDFPFPSFILR
jgi:hypothetical protein